MQGRRILIDGYNLLLPRGTGIATYARNLAITLDRLGAEVGVLAPVQFRPAAASPDLNEIRFEEALPPLEIPPWLQFAGDARDFLASFAGRRPVPLRRRGFATGAGVAGLPDSIGFHLSPRLVERAEAHFSVLGRDLVLRLAQPPQVFHSTYQLPIRIRGAANIYTIHDLIPLRLPGTTRDDKRFTYRLLRHLAARADHIVTVSEHSRRDIMALLGVPAARVTNTYQAVAMPPEVLARGPDQVAEVVERVFELDYRGYYLFFGAIEPKKNVMALIDAYLSAGVAAPLVVVGAEAWMAEAEMARLRDPAFETFRIDGADIRRRRRVRHISYLPRQLLIPLVQGARAVVFPSLYEGFGLPVLEAMLLGTPVITSDTSSLPEVAGDAALLVDPRQPAEIAAAIRRIDADAGLRQELSRRGRLQAAKFSEAAYAERLRALYAGLG